MIQPPWILSPLWPPSHLSAGAAVNLAVEPAAWPSHFAAGFGFDGRLELVDPHREKIAENPHFSQRNQL